MTGKNYREIMDKIFMNFTTVIFTRLRMYVIALIPRLGYHNTAPGITARSKRFSRVCADNVYPARFAAYPPDSDSIDGKIAP